MTILPTLLAGVLAANAAPPPTPSPPANPRMGSELPQPPMEVRAIRSQAGRVRATSAASLECPPMPAELIRPAGFELPLPGNARLAGDGKTLGILLPEEKQRLPLKLIKGGKIIAEYRLKPPPSPPWTAHPRLTLGEEGSYAALIGRHGFAVYAGGVLTATFTQQAHSPSVAFRFGEVMWCPWPQRSPAWRQTALPKLFKEGEEPPLWLRAELDGSRQQALARVDPRRLDPEFPNPAEWAMGIAARSDGRLWLVGLSSAEVWLAGPSGRILRREVLPVRLASEEDDEEAMKKLEEDIAHEVRSTAIGYSDATRRPPLASQLFVTGRIRVVGEVHARDRDLVVTTMTMQPHRALILIPADDTPPRCWTVPGRHEFLSVAVTEDAVWWLEEPEGGEPRLVHALWEDLLSQGGETTDHEGAANPEAPKR